MKSLWIIGVLFALVLLTEYSEELKVSSYRPSKIVAPGSTYEDTCIFTHYTQGVVQGSPRLEFLKIMIYYEHPNGHSSITWPDMENGTGPYMISTGETIQSYLVAKDTDSRYSVSLTEDGNGKYTYKLEIKDMVYQDSGTICCRLINEGYTEYVDQTCTNLTVIGPQSHIGIYAGNGSINPADYSAQDDIPQFHDSRLWPSSTRQYIECRIKYTNVYPDVNITIEDDDGTVLADLTEDLMTRVYSDSSVDNTPLAEAFGVSYIHDSNFKSQYTYHNKKFCCRSVLQFHPSLELCTHLHVTFAPKEVECDRAGAPTGTKNAALVCEALANPPVAPANVTWVLYKSVDWKPIVESDRISIDTEVSGGLIVSTLTFSEVLSTDHQYYEFHVRNMYGGTTAYVSLDEYIHGIGNATGLKSNSILLGCFVIVLSFLHLPVLY